MAANGINKVFFSFVLVSIFAVVLVSSVAQNPYDSTRDIDCGAECARRCRLASRHKMCLRACGTCCARCGCVPPGTSGHYDACACYANMTTHRGRHKCP